MNKKLITITLIAGLTSTVLSANNFDLALDIARYDNIEKSVKNENSIINYINQYILDTGDVLNISRTNIANIYNLEDDSQIFKNYKNELIEISYNPYNKKIEISNLLPIEENYRKMYINSINRNNNLTFDNNIIFTLNTKLKNILNLEIEILNRNLENSIIFSKIEPLDIKKAWFKPDSEGNFYYYYYSSATNKWINLGKIGKGEVLTFNSSEVNLEDLIIFNGQEVSIIDSNNNIENKYFSENTWIDLNNKDISTDTIVPDSVDTTDIATSLTTTSNIQNNVDVGYVKDFLSLGLEEFNKYDIGSTISGTIIDPINNQKLNFNFLKVSDNIFRSINYYNDKLILLVKDLTKIEDVPYTDCYVFPVVDETTINSSYYTPYPYNGKLFSNYLLVNNKYYYVFNSYTSFKNFNSSLYDSIKKPFLKDVLIRNEDNSFFYYKININDNEKLYLITDITNPKNDKADKIVFTYGDKTYFPIAYSNSFNYYALIGGRDETKTFNEETSSSLTEVVFHKFDYLEGFEGIVDRNLAEVPKVSSGVISYQKLDKYKSSRYDELGTLYLKDVVNNKYIYVQKQNDILDYIVDQDDNVLLKNAEEMLYVPKEYLNDWLFNNVVKYDTEKSALVDSAGRTYNDYVYLVETDPSFYFKEFYNKNVFSSNDDVFTADITLVNRDYKDLYCIDGWHLPSNNDLLNNKNINALLPQGYKVTASYSLSNGGIYGIGERHYWVSDLSEDNLPIIKTYVEDRYDDSDKYDRYYYFSITCKSDLSWSQIQNSSEYIDNINKL